MAPSLRFSVSVPQASGLDARALGQHAARIEKLGFHSLLMGDHLYLGERPTVHSVTALAVVAAATEQIPIGFCAYVLPLREPLAAAKELTALDRLSNGRLIAALAAGSNGPEFELFGVPFAERGARLDEGLDALLRLWTGEPVSFEGRFYRIAGAILAPLPIQRPHPPIWIGSWTGNRRSADRVARYAAGWQASGLHTSVEEFRQGWLQVQKAAEACGRDPSTIRTSYVNAITWLDSDRQRAWETVNSGRVGTMRTFPTQEELRLVGTPADVIARLTQLAEAGVEEVAIAPPVSVPEQLDIFMQEVAPAFA